MTTQFVAYLPNSRGRKQQQSAVKRVLRHHRRSGATLAATYVETGEPGDRRELAEAIQQAERIEATLIVTRLGDVAEDVAALQALYRADVAVVFGDTPGAHEGSLGALIVLASRRAAKRARTARSEALAVLLDLMHRSTTVLGIIDGMNSRGIRPPRGDRWTPRHIADVLDRADRQAERLCA